MSVFSLIIVVGVLMAWVVPLVIGIRMLRGPARGGGIVLVILSVLWAVPALTGLVLGGMFWSGLSRSQFETKDFNPTAYTGQLGTVQMAYRGECTLVTRQPGAGEAYRYRSQDGNLRLPVGKHIVESYSVAARDAAGDRWTTTGGQGPERTLTVTRDRATRLEAGPPYQARVTLEDNGSRVALTLALTDSRGQATRFVKNGKPVTPRFEVLDAQNRVVWQGAFAYG